MVKTRTASSVRDVFKSATGYFKIMQHFILGVLQLNFVKFANIYECLFVRLQARCWGLKKISGRKWNNQAVGDKFILTEAYPMHDKARPVSETRGGQSQSPEILLHTTNASEDFPV